MVPSFNRIIGVPRRRMRALSRPNKEMLPLWTTVSSWLSPAGADRSDSSTPTGSDSKRSTTVQTDERKPYRPGEHRPCRRTSLDSGSQTPPPTYVAAARTASDAGPGAAPSAICVNNICLKTERAWEVDVPSNVAESPRPRRDVEAEAGIGWRFADQGKRRQSTSVSAR